MTRLNTTKAWAILPRLRRLVPRRAHQHHEARAVAELQAEHLRSLLGIHTPLLPDDALTALPQTRFARHAGLPASAATTWHDGYWHIVVNGTEPYVRQRFSAAHELFHAIAHPHLRFLTPTATGRDTHREGERLADYFAGVLLMPRDHLVWLWSCGVQQVPELARAFCASERAVAVRLLQVGLHHAPALQLRRRVSAGQVEAAV